MKTFLEALHFALQLFKALHLIEDLLEDLLFFILSCLFLLFSRFVGYFCSLFSRIVG
jgi:hypothetical protein